MARRPVWPAAVQVAVLILLLSSGHHAARVPADLTAGDGNGAHRIHYTKEAQADKVESLPGYDGDIDYLYSG